MANAKKCDICGDFYDPYNYRYLILDPNKGVTGSYFDLCPHCHSKLIDFINPKKAADAREQNE